MDAGGGERLARVNPTRVGRRAGDHGASDVGLATFIGAKRAGLHPLYDAQFGTRPTRRGARIVSRVACVPGGPR